MGSGKMPLKSIVFIQRIKMPIFIYIDEVKQLKFKIEFESDELGYYIYVYDFKQNCIADYMQDTVEICKEFINELYGVPINCWKIQKT